MTLSKRHFTLLNAMDIPLWCRHVSTTSSGDVQKINTAVTQESPTDSLITVDFESLCNNPLFSDILLSLNLTLEAVKPQESKVDCGLFHWQFSSKNALSFQQNILTTPSLEILAQSHTLKRQLWSLIIEHNLLCP